MDNEFAKDFVEVEGLQERVTEALAIIFQSSQVDGAHHKAWAIDQTVRKLLGRRSTSALCVPISSRVFRSTLAKLSLPITNG